MRGLNACLAAGLVHRRTVALFCGVAATWMSCGAAAAESASSDATQTATNIGEVIVTARRVKEDVQKVPIAVTVISAQAIAQQGIVDPIDVQFVAPSVQSYTTFNRLVGGYSVRGIQGSGTYFAEVPGGPTSIPSEPLYDMSSIQVLNGPQGTLFGRTNISGSVLFEPTRPAFNVFNGYLDVSEGNLGLNHDMAAINIPVIPDQLAIRIAAQRDHLDGYTNVLGSDTALNETNNYGARISVNWRPGGGRFTDYAVLDYVGVSETSPGWVLSAYDPNNALFNLPANINAPGGLAYGTAYFGAPCASAVSAGIQSSLNGCINQRLEIAASWGPALQSELARIEAGGNAAVRYTAGPLNPGVPAREFLNQFFFVNQAQYDFGKIGFTTLSIKDIFGIDSSNGSSGWEIDGIGGTLFSSLSGGGGNFAYSNAGNQRSVLNGPAVGYFTDSPFVTTYTDEIQIRGVAGNDLVSWNIGGFYSDTPLPVNLTGIQNIARIFDGVFQPTLGFQPSFSFQNGGSLEEKAVFGQADVNLSRFVPWIKGLHFTAGWRDSWDNTSHAFLNPDENLTTGEYIPGAAVPSATSSSSGQNTTFALDAQLTDNLMIYGGRRTAYVPGGANSVYGASGVFPNYSPTYAPELVTDYEVGAKADLHLGAARARLDADIYQLDFTNIQETELAFENGITATFVVNAAAARMRGFEFQGQFEDGPWYLSTTYSYTDAAFTRWVGSDPLGLIGVGSPQCLPSSPAGECLLNLTDSVFPNIPKNKVSASLTYTLPLPDRVGTVSLTATGAFQSQVWFSTESTRNIQAFSPAIGYQQVANSQGQAPYGIVNLHAEWKNIYGSRVTVGAFADNLTNYNYAVSSIPALQSLGIAVNLYGVPRTFGVRFRYEFGR